MTIQQNDADGNVCENVVCITPEGAYMLRSNCDNQDCIDQGIVTLGKQGYAHPEQLDRMPAAPGNR